MLTTFAIISSVVGVLVAGNAVFGIWGRPIMWDNAAELADLGKQFAAVLIGAAIIAVGLAYSDDHNAQ